MFNVLVILAIIVAILLILIVLVQESKGGGLSSSYSSANSLMGVHKTTDFVEKTTWVLAALLVVFCIATAYTLGGSSSSVDKVVNDAASKKALTASVQAPAVQPQTPAQGGQQAPAQ